MANLFDKLTSSLVTPLSTFGVSGVDQVAARISQNLRNPVSAGANLQRVFGSADEFMARYENFNSVYKMALTKELESTAITTAQKRMIQTAIDSPVINLNLVRDMKQRQNLISMLRNNVIDFDSLIKNFGAPGLGLPSSNLYREAAKYLVDQRSGSNHPILTLINGLTLNINSKAAGIDAIDFGKSNLPSVDALRNAYNQSQKLSSTTDKLFTRGTARKPVKIMTFDVETSGLGVYDQVRSLAASTMQVDHLGTVSHTADGFSTHFITPQMQQYTMKGSTGGTTRLGTGVYQMEKQVGDMAYDLTTAQGRKEAAAMYKKFFQQAVQADIVAGHNVQFDIQKTVMSASALDEFFEDKEAVNAMKAFQKMAEEGKVINTLDIARDYLMRQALDVADTAGADDVLRTQRMINAMFAPETLVRASIGGSATPFSIGNIAAQTNLLKLMQESGVPEGADIVQSLSRGGTAAHQANVDTLLTNFMMQFIHTGELKYGFEDIAGSGISEARKTILKSSAIVPTTNIANVQHMSDAVYRFAVSDAGINSTKLTTDDGIIAFSKSDNAFYKYATDPITGEVKSVKIANQDQARTRIIDAIEASKRGEKSELLETGINYLQASRTDRILQNIAKTRAISTVTTPSQLIAAISGGTNLEAEERFFDALAGTREFLGFNDYQYRPEILADKGITRLINQNFGQISDTAADNYLTKLASAGIASAVDDPYMRRNFVELATITSSTPFTRQAEGATGGFARNIVNRIIAKGGAGAGVDIAEQVSNFNANVGVKIGEYLSEIGVSFADTQASSFLTSNVDATGKMNISRAVIASDILREVDVTTSSGKTVKFLSQEFLDDYGMNKFGLSATQRQEGRVVNLVFGNLAADANTGQRVVSRSLAQELADGIVAQMQSKYSGLNAKQAVERGYFESEAQAKTVMTGLKDGVDSLRDELTESISKRGLGVGSIAGKEAEGVVALLEQIAGGIDNDAVAFQKGMQFAISEYGDNFIAFQGRVDEKVIDALRQSDASLASQIEDGSFLKRAYETYQATMTRATEDTGFAKRLQRAFSSKNLDRGIGGTRIGRGLRDDAVRAAYRKYAPKVGIGMAAVGLLSAGYYIAKKNRENNLYDQVMEKQPTEGRGAVASTNNQLIETFPQHSTRRDPLVTAGVVGNLDRSKIGHTSMGPNKYNHLYG